MKYTYKKTDGKTAERTIVKDTSFTAVRELCVKNDIKYAVCAVDDEIEGKNLLIAVNLHGDGECTIDFAYDFFGYSDYKPRIIYHTLEDMINNNHISYISDDVNVIEQGGSHPMSKDDAFDIYSFALDEVALTRMTADHIGPIASPNVYSYVLERFLKDEGIAYSKLTSKNSSVHWFCIGVAWDGEEKQSLTMTLCFSNEVQLTSFGINDNPIPKSEDDYDNSLFDNLEVFDGDPLNILLANDIISTHVINNFYKNLEYAKVTQYLLNNKYTYVLLQYPFMELASIIADLDNGMSIRITYKDNHYQLKNEPSYFEPSLVSFNFIGENAMNVARYESSGILVDYIRGERSELDENALVALLNGIY